MAKETQKRDKPAPAPRERILAQAVELFAAKGFDAVTMRQLGDAVGLDNSSLYRHFPSKASLIDAVLDRVAAEVSAAVAQLIDPASRLSITLLEDACAAVGVYLFDRPATARLILHWIMSTGEDRAGVRISVPATDQRRPAGKMIAAVREQLNDAVKAGRIRKHATPEALVILIGATVLRPATYGFLLKTLEPPRRHAAARAAWEQELRLTIRGAFAP